jgi:hypothetical protein
MTNPTYHPEKWPFVRTCQECGLPQIAKDPAEYKSDSWKDLKCKRCKSEALDYGSKRPFTPEQIAEYEAWEKWENEQA